MRFQNLLESRNQYLYEGLDASSSYGMRLWENAGIRLQEAALTADQIQKIFQDVESNATAGGSNRTLLGKGKDAAVAVNQAWEDLKTKIQNTAPIKAVDQKYDDVVAKIEKGLGGPDNAVSKMIMKYRKFAKDHPVAQGFIYAALIAAAGISGAGLGGAAVLGLLKMTDKLLQGEKFSSAVYQGAKTGLLAYGASKLGDYLKDKWNTYADPGTRTYYVNGEEVDKATYDAAIKDMDRAFNDAKIDPNNFKPGEADKIAKQILDDQSFDAMGQAQDLRSQLRGPDGSIADAGTDAAKSVSGFASDPNLSPIQQKLAAMVDAGKPLNDNQKNFLFKAIDTAAKKASIMGDMPDGTANAGMRQMMSLQALANAAKFESQINNGYKLSEGQVYLIFQKSFQESYDDFKRQYNELLEDRTDEGPMDYLKKKMTNLTTKITADKLSQAWKKAGSPTDSDQLKTFLSDQGVDGNIIDKVYADLKLPAGSDQNNAAAGGASLYAQVKKTVMTLNSKERQRIMSYLKKQLGTT